MGKLKILIQPFVDIYNSKDLFYQLLKRSVEQKYKGSYLGVLWNFINPMITLIVYSFVFGVIFKSRWPFQVSDSQLEFSVILFVGISIYTVFSEVISVSPQIISANVSYVKKVIFPVQLLPVVVVLTAMTQLFFNVILILISRVLIIGTFDWKPLLFIPIMIPFVFLLMGIAWVMSSLGVFLKDMRQISGILTLILGYMTPIFYSLEAVPKFLQSVMLFNPLTCIVDGARRVLVYGMMPQWSQLLIVTLVSFIFMIISYKLFQKTKFDFPDFL